VTPGQAIPVQSIRGTVLLAGSGNDGQWRSAAFVNDLAQTITRHARAHVIRRIYAWAGHGIGRPIPFTPDVADPSLGGSTTANERAREDLWPRILALL
jgi:hypothetical protein